MKKRPWWLSKLKSFVEKKEVDFLIESYGANQQCTWCGQCMEASWVTWTRSALFDELTCSKCGGTSIWEFGLGFMYMREGKPPSPKFERNADFDKIFPDKADPADILIAKVQKYVDGHS